MRAPVALCLALAAMIFSGCAYKLGPSNGMDAGSQTMQIVPFKNQTIEPRLTDAVTSALRKQLQRDGTFRLGTRGEPDIVVTGVITRYRRSEISFQRDDILTVRDYNLVMFAHVTARERATDKIIFDQEVQGWTLVHVGDDLVSAERQALPILAEDLARNITDLLSDGGF